jgi:hypothetical protein
LILIYTHAANFDQSTCSEIIENDDLVSDVATGCELAPI